MITLTRYGLSSTVEVAMNRFGVLLFQKMVTILWLDILLLSVQAATIFIYLRSISMEIHFGQKLVAVVGMKHVTQ